MRVKKIIQFGKSIINNFRNQIRFIIYKNYLPANPRQDDLYLVEFPKSGITWLSTIIANIYIQIANKDKKEFVTFCNITKYVYETISNKVFIGNLMLIGNERVIKSHSNFNPYYLRVVYILRNPLDVMVSYYNYMQDLGWKGDFIKFVKSKKYGIYAWKNNVNGWINESNNGYNQIHLIKYEDLLKNPVKEIKDIYQNLGENIDINIIEKALELSSIENMKKSEEFYRKHSPNYTMSFVGKEGKIPKEKLLTNEIKEHIIKETRSILERFYPELLI